MLIDFHEAVNKYGLKIRGVIHGGIHFGQEIDNYLNEGITKMLLFEPCEDAYEKVLSRVWEMKDATVYNFALGASSFKTIMNTETVNHGQSNSILKPKKHLEQHPSIVFNGTELIGVETLDSIAFNRNDYNLLVLDTQGYELEVLKGAIKTLPFIDYLYLELNREEIYEGCGQVGEIDAFLYNFGFERVETKWVGGWGDGIFLRFN